MPKNRKLLFVIADGEHVHFVRPAEDSALHADTAMDSFTAHKRSADLGSDHPGASHHTGSSAHHALAPRHNLHVLEKERFAEAVADQLNAAGAAGVLEELVIVAPPHTLTAIRRELDTATDAKIIGTLPKDLVKTPDEDLWPHLRSWIRPVHRAIS
jgi:protein required for attachment to host cells